jgi:hypothetical protein
VYVPLSETRKAEELTLPLDEEYPKGFPQLAAFISSDNDFAVFRGFKYFHYRILLELEVEITEMERELWALDHADEADPDMRYRLQGMLPHEEGYDTGRIKEKVKEYGELR